ncbi:MAG: succinate dehydrogenase, hydrophobic membrane anchor protein [Gammaproteobacteria bacterium RIFCSPHIGHO2_12_FULL_38_14]|nr:MAG: succinate dehydrogenase, hydrophobic membrane anchor protein [Gammaproteobacteria bacterium RIFCSPHIGHO2_12_FULL_38_14]
MVKSVLGVHHQGLRDWAFQRISAIILALYSIGLLAYLFFHPDLSYLEWRYLFSLTWMKIITIFFILSLMFHAWIGVWTVFTDYVKPYIIRSILNIIVLLSLGACFIWGILILWSV